MTTILTFTVPGPPRPKERPRVTSRGVFTPRRTSSYEGTVRIAALAAVCRLPGGRQSWPLDAWYRLSVALHLKDRRIPDVDNVLKAIADGCESVLWENDRRVCEVVATIAEVRAEEPHAIVFVRVVDPPQGWENRKKVP